MSKNSFFKIKLHSNNKVTRKIRIIKTNNSSCASAYVNRASIGDSLNIYAI